MSRLVDAQVHILVERAKGGEPEAFGAIYDEFFDRIYAYISWRVSTKQEAEDLTQNVFIRALEALPRYEKRGAPFSAWLFRIAHNLVVNHYRQKDKSEYVQIDDLANTLDGGESPAQAVIDGLSAEALREAMTLLTEEQQQVVTLKFLGGLSNDEIADAMEKPIGAVKALQHRGLTKLGQVLRSSASIAAPEFEAGS